MITKRRIFLLCGLAGTLVLAGCSGSGADSDSGFTLPIVNSIPVLMESSETSTTVPMFEELYTIQSGDTLFEIAQAFGVTMDDLISYNGISNPDSIPAGQVLKIPSPANPSGMTSSTSMAP